MDLLKKLASLFLLSLVLAAGGCATLPGPLKELVARLEGEDEEEEEAREREMRAISAKYNLEVEADEHGLPTAAQILRAHEQRQAILREALVARPKAAGLQASQWQALGPLNVGGRVRTMAFDPRNPSRLLAGTASGGLWISEDAGGTWRVNNDFLPNLSISTLAFDRGNGSIAYLGTGEASAGLVGIGAFKSTDGGNTWKLLDATNVDTNPDWRFVNRIAVHPQQPQILLAGVTNNNLASGAIYRSGDGGATWTRTSGFKALDIAFDPMNPANAVAGLDDGTIAWSRDTGVTWTRTARLVTPSGRGNTARAEIAFAASQPGLVYASLDNNKGEVWRSNDSGQSWTMLSNPKHLNEQGDYDNAIWVDPIDPNHVVVAGLDIYDSRDGGATFTKVSDWTLSPESPHADHHVLVSPPNFGAGSSALFNGNDGGVYRAPNAYALDAITGWQNANNGLAVTQFYSGAGRTAAGGRIVGGTQDNGSLMLSNGTWRPFRGGDGGFVAVDPQSDTTLYGEYVYLSIHRSVNGGGFSGYICTGITEALTSEGNNTYCGASATKKANFIAPFILDPNNPNRLLAGADSLWVSDNARAPTPTWRAIKPPSPATENYINAIGVPEGDSATIWVGHNNGEVYRTTDGLSAAPTWTRVGAGVLPARRVQRIYVDAQNRSRAIVAVTGFVADNLWQTLDNGATWTSITGNLPSAPIFDVKRHPVNASWLYVATSVGVFTSEDGGAHWSTTNEGPANIRVRELFWLDNQTLGAATYGRGMFKASVAAGGAPSNYQDLWWAAPNGSENGWGMNITQHGAVIFAAFFVYDAAGKPVWLVMPGGSWDAGFTTFSGALFRPTSSFFGNYDTSRFRVGTPVGTGSLRFTAPDQAVFSYTIDGIPAQKAITRNLFGPRDATPVATYGDLWWGGASQDGWGIALSQQYRTLFAVWYTYDADGRTLWYVMPGGSWTAANVYSGTAYRTTGSAWLGVPYNPAVFNPQPVGSITFTFTDPNNAIMSYSVDGVTQSKPITKLAF